MRVGRHVVTQRANGLYSRYSYDAGGRLRELRHHDRAKTLARFLYQVDQRGNRTQAFEELARPSTIVQTIGISDGAVSYYKGTWTTSGSYKQTTQFSSAMTITFTGKESTLTLGTGTDHAIFDIYIDGSLWESFDGYSASGIDRTINIYLDKRLDQTDAHVIDIRNRAEKNKNSTGYTLRFKQLTILNTVYDQQTINYGYDALARLLTATYAGVSPTRSYAYAFDRNGNRTQQVVTVGGTPTTTNYTYNAVNQLTSGGATYDNNGNLTSDGTNSYTWDRANRLARSVRTTSTNTEDITYKYNGLGMRVFKSVVLTPLDIGVIVSQTNSYLLDLQPELAQVLIEKVQGIESAPSQTNYYVHSPRGLHAQNTSSGFPVTFEGWEWVVQDGLGSVRGVVDNSVGVLESRNYDPYGTGFGATGSSQTNFGFTGEQTDGTGLVYLRNRYMSPALGQFVSLDPMEGRPCDPMSLNGYSYVAGNPINMVDPSGMIYELPSMWASCVSDFNLSSLALETDLMISFYQGSNQACAGFINRISALTIPTCTGGRWPWVVWSFYGPANYRIDSTFMDSWGGFLTNAPVDPFTIYCSDTYCWGHVSLAPVASADDLVLAFHLCTDTLTTGLVFSGCSNNIAEVLLAFGLWDLFNSNGPPLAFP